MFLLYTLITGLCTYSCFKYAKNRRYTNLLFDRFHVEAPKHMMSLIEFNEETNDDDSHLYRRMYTDYFYDDYLFDEYPSPLVGGVNTPLPNSFSLRRDKVTCRVSSEEACSPLPQEEIDWTQLLQDTENMMEAPDTTHLVIECDDTKTNVDISDMDDTPSIVPFPTIYEELYMNPRKYKIMKKRNYFGNDQRPQEEPPDNILEKIRDNIQKKQLLDFLQQPIRADDKIKAYEKVFPYSSGLLRRPSEYALPHSKPVFSPGNILAGGLMKDFDTPEI